MTMKILLLAICLVALASCESKPSEAEVNTAREKISERGSRIGYSEANLQHAKEPGEVALAAEELRGEKEKLELEIAEMKNVITRDEALKISELSQTRSRERMLQAYAENAAALERISSPSIRN